MDEAYAAALAAHSARYPRGPVTAAWLAEDLNALGVAPGQLLMVHCSLKELGWVPGGPAGIYHALAHVSNCDGGDLSAPQGTLLMPAFDSNNTEPSQWKAPPVDPRWWPVVRAEQPAFDPATTPSIRMGALAEYFRTLPGTRRSHHPHVSWCGRGPLAEDLLRDCPLDYALGEDSPLGRTYERGGWVLSLGCRRTTVLHLAEHRCAWRGRAVLRQGSSMLVEGRRQWVEYELQTDENADFEALRQAYMLEQAAERGSTWHEAPCGYGQARLFAVRPLIDFAAGWLAAHRV